MKRIKIILAVVAAVATMMVLSAPAMAQTSLFVPNANCPTFCFTGTSSGVGDFDDGFRFRGGDFEVPVLVDLGSGFFAVCQLEFDDGSVEDVDC